MVLAFILLVLVIVFVFYWKIQAVRSKCLDASFYRRRVGERNKIRIAVMCDDAILMRPFDDVGMVKKWDLNLRHISVPMKQLNVLCCVWRLLLVKLKLKIFVFASSIGLII